MSSGKPPKPPRIIPPPPKPDEALMDETREQTRRRLAALQGRISTMLTGPGGLVSAPPVAVTRALGGG